MADILSPRGTLVRLKAGILAKRPARPPGVELPPIEVTVYADVPEPEVTRKSQPDLVRALIQCRICGDIKERWQFSNLPEYFKVCSDCEFSVYPISTPRDPEYGWADANLITLTRAAIKLLEREIGTTRRSTGPRSGRSSSANVQSSGLHELTDPALKMPERGHCWPNMFFGRFITS